AKNYYTCHNTSINNLGFIEFTDVYYIEKQPIDFDLKANNYNIVIRSTSNLELHSATEENALKSSETTLLQDINKFASKTDEATTLHLFFSQTLSFQDHISLKSRLNKLTDKNDLITIAVFIFN